MDLNTNSTRNFINPFINESESAVERHRLAELLATPDTGENMPMNQNNPGDPLNAKSKTRYQATMAVAMARARQTDRDPKGVQALRKQSPQGTNNNG